MPFSLREFDYCWRHVLLGVNRRLLGQPRDKYIVYWQAKGVPMQKLQYENKEQSCQICGYNLAELELLPAGWLLQACSAVGFDSILGNDRVTVWSKQFEALNTDGSTPTKTSGKSRLPTRGV